MDLNKVVKKQVSAGVLLGAIFLTGMLFFLQKSEEKALELTYMGRGPLVADIFSP